MSEKVVIKKTLELHPYEYLLIQHIRNLQEGEFTVKVQKGLPQGAEETKKSRVNFQTNAVKLGLIRDVS